MQANVENHRTRLADVEKKLTEIETVLGELMSRVLTAEGNIGNCGEITKKITPKRIGKQSSQKGRTT
jgi:hypothetical protein